MSVVQTCRIAACISLCAALACGDDQDTQAVGLRQEQPSPQAGASGAPRPPSPMVTPHSPSAVAPVPPPMAPEFTPPPPLPPFRQVPPTELPSTNDTTPIAERDLATLEPGGPLPDCRTKPAETPRSRETRWLAVRTSDTSNEVGAVLIEMGDAGAGPAHPVGPLGGLHPVGEWSRDGRFFATGRRGDLGSEATFVADLESGMPVVSEFPGRFLGLAPRSARILTLQEGFVVRDLEQPDIPAVEIPLPPPRYAPEFVMWSGDGRYFSYLSGDALADSLLLHVIDIREGQSRTLPVTPPTWPLGWARLGHRLAYTVWSAAAETTEVVVLDVERDDPPLTISDVDSRLDELVWIDDTRLLLRDGLSNPLIVDVTGDMPVRSTLDAPDAHGQRLLGDHCMVYVGGCGPSKLLGTCVAALDPGAPPEARRVFPGDDDLLVMPTHGSPLVFDDWRENRIIEVALEGDAFEPRRLTGRTHRGGDGSQVAVASGPDPNWVNYAAPSSSFAPLATPHFWNRRTQRTYEFDPQSRGFGPGGVWSPDGTVFATRMYAPERLDDRPFLTLTRLDDSTPLQQYAVDVAVEQPLGSEDGWLAWQP